LEFAHKKAIADAGWDEAAYCAAYFMEKKIEFLHDHLPVFLVQNRKLYNILSAGIHELTEAQCAEGYELARLGITLIVEEEIAQAERTKLIASVGPSLQRLQERYEKKDGKSDAPPPKPRNERA
jgi:hypothetical protein